MVCFSQDFVKRDGESTSVSSFNDDSLSSSTLNFNNKKKKKNKPHPM